MRVKNLFKKISVLYTIIFVSCTVQQTKISSLGSGWTNNSVNTVKFRKNALTSFGDYQFIAYYDAHSFLTLGKRKLTSKSWEKITTPYKGHTKDAHNAISIAIDGNGYLHVSWDHHNTRLRYARSKVPLGLELGAEEQMTGIQEDKVTYPEFYNLPNGDLLFFYRSGQSGRGNMVINTYNLQTKSWTQLHHNLIDGEGQRSAYWQACIDNQGIINLSWVWRETWGVETNHDLCFARSRDGGKTWEKSTGESYALPITAVSAEYAWKIPQKSSLINQTAMTTDKNGNPYIATYWNENNLSQFQIVYLNNANTWKKINTGFRTTAFYLGGGGTKRIPISRPEILINDSNTKAGGNMYLLYRDEERGNKVSLAVSKLQNSLKWEVKDLTQTSVGQWEPNYDIALWKKQKQLHIFLQNVRQIDGEGIAEEKPSQVSVLEIKI